MQYNILIVEDQKEISAIVAKYLDKEGYNISVADNGFEALDYFNNHECHLVILDIMMPGISGFDVLREIRKISEIPVIMLTARQEEFDRIKGFDIGADDYVVKPFSARELMKRIRAIIKRTYHESNEIIYSIHDLDLHTKGMKLYKDHKEVELTSVEFRLLFTFFRNKGQVLTRQQLIELSFGNEYEGYDRNIDSYIKRIRQKIEDNPQKPELLKTKYGSGYVFGGDVQ
ncbi:MAG: response regulator transcription factor [Clostridia bacterium]|nr:response regulator transcription factor [Clostridia bacterium]